jgi:thiamine-phosphate pyrophosphorylase
VVGLQQLEKCRASCLRPLVAIGGITRQNAGAVFAAGADTVAVIRDLLPEPLTSATLRRRMEEWQQLAQK